MRRPRKTVGLLLAGLLASGVLPATAQWPAPGQQPRTPSTDAPSPGDDAAMGGGCSWAASGSDPASAGIQPWSGIPMIDQAYQREGLMLIREFGVTPAGAFLHDQTGPNAYATPEPMFRNGPDGTVLFGMTLMGQELRRDGGVGIGVPAIMAHEFAHILQFRRGDFDNSPTVYRELHADFMAGWYMARRSRIAPVNLEPAIRSFFEKGDYVFNSPNHHGTPAQRVSAFMAGMRVASLSVDDAFDRGLDFVGGGQ